MEKEKPQTSNQIKDSEVHVGGNIQQAHTIYNNYFQGRTVEIPRHLTLHIPVNADHILGRENELDTIAGHLAHRRPTVLVNGIGGIGKTAVAAKYMATRSDAYKHLAWLTVQSSLTETFFSNTVLLDALQLHEKVKELVENQQTTAAFELVMAHLDRLEKTLIVLDNANNLPDLVEFKPLFDTARCHFLITSRSRPQDWAVVGIHRLPREEAVALFKKLAPSVEQEGVTDDDIGDLLERLFYHTLLIELVAKALTNAGFPFAEIQQMVAEKFIHDPALNEDIISTGSHGNSLRENAKRAKIEEYIWLIFSEVKDLSDSAQQILRAISLLPLATAFDRDFLKKHLEFFEIKDIVPALTLLTERGWLEKEQVSGQKPQYKMHPLIGDVVVKHLEVGVEFAAGYIGRVADLIDYDPQNPEHNLFEINNHRPLAERLSELFFKENTAEVSKLLSSIGYLEENFGFYQKSAYLKERALVIAECIFEMGHKKIAVRQNDLASVYIALGHYEKAAELLESAIDCTEKNLGKGHPNITVYQSNLAKVYSDLGRYEKAVELLESTLDSDLKNFGKGHPKTAISLANLANVYSDLGRYEKAVELLESALDSDLKNFGKEHPKVAIRQNDLANVYSSLGRYEKAAELLESALNSDLKNFGKEHPNISRCQSNLGDVYRLLGRYEKAAELLESALNSDMKNFGRDHPRLAFRQNNLAIVYYNTGRPQEAKELWQSAYQNFFKNLGPDHPHTKQVKEYSEW